MNSGQGIKSKALGAGRRALADEVPVGYKRTEVGVIPEDWECLRFGDAVNLLTGFPFPSSGYVNSGVLLVRGSNVKRGTMDWGDEITRYWPAITSEIARYELCKGDLIIAMDGALVGRSYAVISDADLPSLLLQRVARIRSSQLHQNLLAFLVANNSFVNHVDAVKTHTAIPHISPEDIRSFLIAVPTSTNEQRAIAEALSDVDGLLAALEALIAKKRAIKQATMQQLLTGKTRLPGFSGEWETKRLGSALTVRHGRSQRYITGPDGKYPILASGGEIGRTDVSLYDKPSVLIGRKGTIDDPQYVSSPFWTVDTLFYTEIADGMSAKFLYYKFCMIPWRSYNEASGVPSLNSRTIENIEVNLPKSDEQRAIAAVLSDMDAEIAALERRWDKTRTVKQGMMQQLLTGQVRLVQLSRPTEDASC